ncbi:AGE family epimerase/isomerase [Larkinella soli]|uniref:AGE family epimerase/isomerase n=1 Tax=Larkinella soli TaxID=1770527 RepID=UPI000FFB337F|nr:AGE family epimerase/isomerase [Larkinella soli]
MEFSKLAAQYQEALFRTILPFWITHSRDLTCGGYYNALTDQGVVFDTDKLVALQAQQVWGFSFLHHQVDAIPEWLSLARHGVDFLLKHGRQPDGRWLDTVDRRGRPVTPARTVVPDCSAVMAFARFFRCSGDEEHALTAQQTLHRLLEVRQNQRERWEAELGGFRQFKHLSEPMMVLKAVIECQSLLSPEFFKQTLETVIAEIQNEFYDKRINLLRENVLPEGAFCDCTTGRRLHGGYVFETAGYLLEAAELTGNRRLAQQAVQMALHLAEICWDEPSGGFIQYADLKDRPGIYSEWDRKIWWTHTEALSVFVRGYHHTRMNDCLKWFQKVHSYTWQHFPDKDYKEWFGILDRKNEPVLTSKATPQKGCYHLIKGLHDTWKGLEQCARIAARTGGIRTERI